MYLKREKPFACKLLIALHLFLALGALFGGGALIISPDGSLLHISLDVLKTSPFHTYFIPGILLLLFFGILPLLISIFLITEKASDWAEKFSLYYSTHWAWNYSLYIGFFLIIWITIQMYMMQTILFIHVFYIFLGLLLQFVNFLPSVKNHYSH